MTKDEKTFIASLTGFHGTENADRSSPDNLIKSYKDRFIHDPIKQDWLIKYEESARELAYRLIWERKWKL